MLPGVAVAVISLMVYHIGVEWAVDFYQEPDGSAPVEEFLDSLRPEGRAKALALVQALRPHGPSLPFPIRHRLPGRYGNCVRSMARTKSEYFTSPMPDGSSFCCMDS